MRIFLFVLLLNYFNNFSFSADEIRMTAENTQTLRIGEEDFKREFFGAYFEEVDLNKFCHDNNCKLKASIVRSLDKIIISYKFLVPDEAGAELFLSKRFRLIIETSVGIPGNTTNENIDSTARSALNSIMKSLKFVKP